MNNDSKLIFENYQHANEVKDKLFTLQVIYAFLQRHGGNVTNEQMQENFKTKGNIESFIKALINLGIVKQEKNNITLL